MKSYIIKSKYYDLLTPEERADCCNGCGPEWFPNKFRHRLDKILYLFRVAFDQHDIGYEYGETWEEKEITDLEFLKNMKAICWHEILAKDFYSWNSWKEYFKWMAIARALFEAVEHGGGFAFWNDEKLIRLGLQEAPPFRA